MNARQYVKDYGVCKKCGEAALGMAFRVDAAFLDYIFWTCACGNQNRIFTETKPSQSK